MEAAKKRGRPKKAKDAALPADSEMLAVLTRIAVALEALAVRRD
jgi:hypothetical protein